MFLPALLLLLSASTSVTLFDDTVRIPPMRSSGLNLTLRQRPAEVRAKFEVQRGKGEVRAMVMTREDAMRMQRGQSYRVLAVTGYAAAGSIEYTVGRPDSYMVVLENHGAQRGSAMPVKLQVDVAFNNFTSFAPQTATPERRRAVVVLSLMVFAMIGSWSGRRLLDAAKHRDAA